MVILLVLWPANGSISRCITCPLMKLIDPLISHRVTARPDLTDVFEDHYASAGLLRCPCQLWSRCWSTSSIFDAQHLGGTLYSRRIVAPEYLQCSKFSVHPRRSWYVVCCVCVPTTFQLTQLWQLPTSGFVYSHCGVNICHTFLIRICHLFVLQVE